MRVANREFLEPFEPHRPEDHFTVAGMERWIGSGDGPRFAILDGAEIVGVVNLSHVVRDSLQSANVGYWVDSGHNGRGLATRAVAAIVEHAFGELGLHRVEVGTRLDNAASQRVLEKNRFQRFGLARRHLLIAGEWRDQILFERLADD